MQRMISMNNKKNKLNNRKLIYNFISENPGVYQIEISKALNISASTVNYHLRYLNKKGLITKQKENRYIRYYLSEKISSFEKKVLSILRQETPCNIVLYLIIETCASQIELSKRLEKHPSTITFHLKKLLDMDIIERLSVENGKIIARRLKEPKFVEYDPVSNDAVYKLKNLSEISNHVVVFQNIEEVIEIGDVSPRETYNYYYVLIYTYKSDAKKEGFLIGNLKKKGDIIIGIWPFNKEIVDSPPEDFLKSFNNLIENPHEYSNISLILS